MQDAIAALKAKVDATIAKTGPDHVQAENFLKSLTGMAGMLKSPNVEEVLAAVEKFSGSTVADLLAFMQLYNLRFGAAKTTNEKRLYHDLYGLMDRQRDQIVAQVAGRTPVADPEAGVTPPAGATNIFHQMPWEHLNGQPPAPDDSADPKKDGDAK